MRDVCVLCASGGGEGVGWRGQGAASAAPPSTLTHIRVICICICILRIKAYACTSINKINNYYVLSYSNYYTKSNKQLL